MTARALPQANQCTYPRLVRELLLVRVVMAATLRKNTENKKRRQIMLWAIVIAGTYVAGIYLIRLVWWQE